MARPSLSILQVTSKRYFCRAFIISAWRMSGSFILQTESLYFWIANLSAGEGAPEARFGKSVETMQPARTTAAAVPYIASSDTVNSRRNGETQLYPNTVPGG